MKKFYLIFFGFALGISLLLSLNFAGNRTSTANYCQSCHVHTYADNAWKKSTHYLTNSGMKIECVECHLPPKGQGYWLNKIKLGSRDLYSYLFKDSASIDWESKRLLENAVEYLPQKSCLKCHQVLFPPNLSKEGEEAHLYYKINHEKKDIVCINCHLYVGHYSDLAQHGNNIGFGSNNKSNDTIYEASTEIKSFETFVENIPGTSISFKMLAINGGKFKMGSPEDESLRKENEGPQADVEVGSFFFAETETTWDEFIAFYFETGKEGRTTDTDSDALVEVDAISGPTPPYGLPDRGWGMGKRPAISMSFHAAEVYCHWLSEKTGKTYRLPTEAEWEYAARGGTKTPYYFEGSPDDFDKKGWAKRFGTNETEPIAKYEIYKENSGLKTDLPESVLPNPYGLKNILGNVAEFCSDWYNPKQLELYKDKTVTNPAGPPNGTEHVVKGGSYKDPAGQIRSAIRRPTNTNEWMKTDPQMPKSIWWYSDCFHVGFRVVCEYHKVASKN